MTPRGPHAHRHCTAGNPPNSNQSIRTWLGLHTAVEGASPEQMDATTAITTCPVWDWGSGNCAKCSLFIMHYWSCVLDCVFQKHIRATSSWSSARCNFISPPGEHILINLQRTNTFNWPDELILNHHSWLQIHFKYTLWISNINAVNFRLTFFQGTQKSLLRLWSSVYGNN